VRADTGVRAGDEITPFYDPMIAKVIVHAEDRGTALRRLHKALLNCEIAGSVTNLAFLGALAEHQGFRDGDFDTGLIGRDLAVLTRAAAPAVSDWVAAGMAALDLDDLPEDAGFTLWQPLSQRVTLSFAEETRVLTVTVLKARTLRWSVGEDEALAEQGGEGWRVAGVPLTKTHRSGSEVTVFAQYGLRFLHVDPLDVASGENAHSDVVTAPMPGRVMAIYAKPGQPVTAGERLAVLEAMKMEHTLLSPRAGVVEEVLAAEGDQVGATAPLIALVPEEEA
jgi:3-methylcrotonyl-CoA carboxylase alpha subunit